MTVKRFDFEADLQRLETYLRNQYLQNHNMTSWLPERLHDLIYRMDTQYADAGQQKSRNYIFLWEDCGEIVACILPDGDAIYISISSGYEPLFDQIVCYAEEHCSPLFPKEEDGSIDFLVVSNDALAYRVAVLQQLGYTRQAEEDYDNYIYPQQVNLIPKLPDGYRLVYGHEYTNEINKWSACNLGFHPDLEAPDYKNGMSAYYSRKESSMYPDSFECLVIDEAPAEQNNVCSYCFVYVDMASKTAFIEPVSTREKYRHKGLGTAMMHGAMVKCKELGVEKCYVNSYDWRRKFYNASGFITEDSIGFWHKKLGKR